jgi:hypothetical protein
MYGMSGNPPLSLEVFCVEPFVPRKIAAALPVPVLIATAVEVWDHSGAALAVAASQGLTTKQVDLLSDQLVFPEETVIVCTETLEHFEAPIRHKILEAAKNHQCFFSVPNDRLGPEEEPQHAVQFTALEFLTLLRTQLSYTARVEVIGPAKNAKGVPAFLLGVVGLSKMHTLSMTMPVRDESEDIELVLASFRGVCDEIVIGIDPRTKDNTYEICKKYCETVFYLEELRGPPGEEVPEGGFHFSHARNQCIRKCTSKWIFMTEGHERLGSGVDALLNLGKFIPKEAMVAFVLRTGQGQQWGFPWLFRNKPDTIKFRRATHNDLDFPESYLVVRLPQIKTIHQRVHERDVARQKQRKVQNRITLMQDWMANQSEMSLYYLGSEWREYDEERAMQYLRQFITINRSNGPMRYNTRLILCKMLGNLGRLNEAREVLLPAVGDDWSRTEHWVWLGDILFEQERYDEALQFYLYGSTKIGEPPFTLWWIDLAFYSYIPAQRLAMCYSALGQLDSALQWAKNAKDLLPEDAPEELVQEHITNIKTLEEALSNGLS